MSTSAMRIIACAGALAAGLLFGGAGVGTAFADTGDSSVSDAGADDTPTVSTDVETTPEDGPGKAPSTSAGSADDDSGPVTKVGNGRTDVVDPNDPRPAQDQDTPSRADDGTPARTEGGRSVRKYESSLLIPMLRIPTAEEFAEPGFVPVSAYIGTAEIPFPSLADMLRALSRPEPEPAPGPAFRTQEEAPVADATPDGGGGSVRAAASDTPDPFRAPLVVAPRVPSAAGPRTTAIGSAAGAPKVTAASPQTAVAGVRTPLIRGTLPPTGSAPLSRPLTPGAQSPPAGYPRYLRNPTVGQLAAVALPGVAGLMLLTFGGGVIGYRQANSGRFLRTSAAARFLP